MTQYVIDIKLKGLSVNAFRHIWAETEYLKPATIVRVHVGATPPHLATSCPWYRSDLTWQINAADSRNLLAWQDALAHISGIEK